MSFNEPTNKMNDVDISNILGEKGYAVEEIKILGPNGGTTLSGDTWEDVIAYKDKVYIPIDALSEEDLFYLMRNLRTSEYSPYVKLYYKSPNYGCYRESMFIRGEMTHNHVLTSNSGVDYYDKNTIVLTEA